MKPEPPMIERCEATAIFTFRRCHRRARVRNFWGFLVCVQHIFYRGD